MTLLKVKQIAGPIDSKVGSAIAFDGTHVVWTSDLSSALLIPQGSTQNRPNDQADIFLRFNTDTNLLEGNLSGTWENLATLTSPNFSGTPTAPTAPVNTNNSIIATTAYVNNAIANLTGQTVTQPVEDVIVITDGFTYQCSGVESSIIIKKPMGPLTTIILPINPFTGQTILIKDGGGTADVYSITVATTTSTIDGQTTLTIDQPYVAYSLLYDGSDWNIT